MASGVSVKYLDNWLISSSYSFNYDPTVTVPPKHFEDPEVSGRQRYRYFKRLVVASFCDE